MFWELGTGKRGVINISGTQAPQTQSVGTHATQGGGPREGELGGDMDVISLDLASKFCPSQDTRQGIRNKRRLHEGGPH